MTKKHTSTYILMDADGNPWGPFKQVVVAAEFAALKWRDQKEAVGDDYGNLSEGWTIYALRHPDT